MKLSELLKDRGQLTNRMAVPVLLSTDAARRLDTAQKDVETAEARLKAARQAEDERLKQPRTEAAKAELEQAEVEYEAARDAAAPHLIDFVVESVGSDEWEQLVNAHPPTKEQRETLTVGKGAGPEFNPQTFPLAAVAACLKEPEVDGLEDVKQLKAKVPDIVWQQLFSAVLRVNRGANRVDPSWLGSATTTPSSNGSEQP